MNGSEIGQAIRALFSFGSAVGVQVVCALICAAIFYLKGKSPVGGAFLGFFLGPFGVFIAVVSGPWPKGRWGTSSHRAPQPPPAEVYTAPRPSNVYVPQAPAPPKRTYRLPDRCPNCNGPLHRKEAEASSVTCWYCGSNVEGS
jgi:hypothetical protein